MTREFTCDGCGEVFESAWSQEEAEAEALKLFGELPQEDNRGSLCDDCYKEFIKWLKFYPTMGAC